jgi:uncharacterized protein YukE
MYSTTLRRSVFLLPLLAAWLTAPSAARADVKYPHMHQALCELQEARVELKTAAHDFGGHREAALKAVDVAVAQLNIALDAVGDRFRGLAGDNSASRKSEQYPHIHRAVQELKETSTELKNAKQDFGGHRADALRDVNFAIEQLELALKFARK